ncbi:MAG: DUF3795 domain-containing protein [Promethearchaeota archaeon]
MKEKIETEDLTEAQKWIAPCGINCYVCSAHNEGVITQHAEVVRDYLKGFGKMVPAFLEIFPIYKHYDHFKAILEDLAEGKCEGCRSGNPANAACKIYKDFIEIVEI